jgi:hypothetical protein
MAALKVSGCQVDNWSAAPFIPVWSHSTLSRSRRSSGRPLVSVKRRLHNQPLWQHSSGSPHPCHNNPSIREVPMDQSASARFAPSCSSPLHLLLSVAAVEVNCDRFPCRLPPQMPKISPTVKSSFRPWVHLTIRPCLDHSTTTRSPGALVQGPEPVRETSALAPP